MFLHNLKKKIFSALTLKIPSGGQNPAALAEWNGCLDKSEKCRLLLLLLLLLSLLLLLCAYSVKITSQKLSSSQHAYSVISRSLIYVLKTQFSGKLL